MEWNRERECVVCEARAVNIVRKSAGWAVSGSRVMGSIGRREVV